jgi:hypothetical protein
VGGVRVVQLPHDSRREKRDVWFRGESLVMEGEVPAPQEPLPGGGPSLPRLPLPHALELRPSPLLHLNGPALRRRTTHRPTTTNAGVVRVGMGVHHRETDVVHWWSLETTAVVQSRTGLGVDPGTLLCGPLVVEGGGTTGHGRSLVGVWGGEDGFCVLPVGISQQRRAKADRKNGFQDS